LKRHASDRERKPGGVFEIRDSPGRPRKPVVQPRRSEGRAAATGRSGERLVFKKASEPCELDEVHRLNYRTFVQEIPQHETDPRAMLVDRYHEQNTYFICLDRRRLVGMVALRGERPLSLEEKLDGLEQCIPPGKAPCEIRLLAVDPAYRDGRVFRGLVRLLVEEARQRGYDLFLISGLIRRQRLYESLGFVSFGPTVGTPEVPFQPMVCSVGTLAASINRPLPGLPAPGELNLSTGPVTIGTHVSQALAGPAVPHRSGLFSSQLARVKSQLTALANARRVEIVVGTGTLANDIVAGQLSLLGQHGLVLSNGEFGDRLLDHARRHRLEHAALRVSWGERIEPSHVAHALDRQPRPAWLWAVHCETSTGHQNDLHELRQLCSLRDVRLCLDCVSSLGAIPVDLDGVWLATGVSGKALGAFPGLAFVFYIHDVEPAPDVLPRYLDLGLYRVGNGVPFTSSSNLLAALGTALFAYDSPRRLERIAACSRVLVDLLRAAGIRSLAEAENPPPFVFTLPCPRRVRSEELGRAMEDLGFQIGYLSGYLRERNWVQLCVTEGLLPDRLEALVGALRSWLSPGGYCGNLHAPPLSVRPTAAEEQEDAPK
jgi:aspartate aminotransferase-like enzyme/GNAT superfamily N-acetyltransferase